MVRKSEDQSGDESPTDRMVDDVGVRTRRQVYCEAKWAHGV